MFYVLGALRGLCIVVGLILGIVHFSLQFWQTLPTPRFQMTPKDWILILLAGFFLCLGFNNYIGLIPVALLILWKWRSGKIIQHKLLKGKGLWIEIQWQRFQPKSLSLPPMYKNELQKIPVAAHFILPRWLVVVGLKYGPKLAAQRAPQYFSNPAAQSFLQSVIQKVNQLKAGRNEKIQLPIGVIKIFLV